MRIVLLSTGVAIWTAMAVYWIFATRRAKGGALGESNRSRLLHLSLFWFSVLLALAPGIGPLGERWLPESVGFDAAGLTVQMGGVALYFWARAHMGRFWSGIISSLPDHRLVRGGPYRLLRHPMYAGILAMFLGTAILVGEWRAMIALGIVIGAYSRKIRMEERHLRRIFGEEYAAFARECRAVIPWMI